MRILEPTVVPVRAPLEEEHQLRMRIQAEFREMPGLTLTLPQAARLFSVEPARCECVLLGLVADGCLAINGSAFVSSRAGRRSA